MEDLGVLCQRRESPRSMTLSLKVWPGRVTTQRKQVPRISASRSTRTGCFLHQVASSLSFLGGEQGWPP